MNFDLALRSAPAYSVRRTFPLKDIAIRSDGTGRTVEAFAAVYDTAVEVSDWEGEYEEIIRRGAFARTIRARKLGFQVFYNHGTDLYGQSSDRYAMPLGVPVEVRDDPSGVWTATRYANTPLADEVLELIREGAIRGQSFSGRWIKSRETRAATSGRLRLVERTEVEMREYGPTPFPVYEAAKIAGVRSVADLAREFADLSDEDRAELGRILNLGTPVTPATPGTDDGDPPPHGTDPEPTAATTPTDEDTVRELERYQRIHAIEP